MNLSDFRDSVAAGTMPPNLSLPLQALWTEASGDWHQAHLMVQNANGPEAAWVHAYLHRKEGDTSNATYWYRRANRVPTQQMLEEEWSSIADALLQP